MLKKPKLFRKTFKVLTGMIVGGAIGSILGFTLAPKKGKETREYLRDKSMGMFLKGKDYMKEEETKCLLKRCLLKLLKPKNRK